MDQDDTNVLSQTRGTRESQGREGGQQSQMLQRLSKFGFRKPFILNIVMSIYPGEGNGNPLQYSCLENPRDRGAPSIGGVRGRHQGFLLEAFHGRGTECPGSPRARGLDAGFDARGSVAAAQHADHAWL